MVIKDSEHVLCNINGFNQRPHCKVCESDVCSHIKPEPPCHIVPSADKKADSTAKKIARGPGSGVTETRTATINLLQQGGLDGNEIKLLHLS
jgi:hypothetical protein